MPTEVRVVLTADTVVRLPIELAAKLVEQKLAYYEDAPPKAEVETYSDGEPLNDRE